MTSVSQEVEDANKRVVSGPLSQTSDGDGATHSKELADASLTRNEHHDERIENISDFPRDLSPALSLPDLQALLASTQTGRKSRASHATQSDAQEGTEDVIMEENVVVDRTKASQTASNIRKRRLSASAQTSSQPAKRQNVARRRHQEFWALDGSVVLQFEDVMFRLHRSDLVRRSKYFAELLENQDRREGSETIDGCPLYRLPGTATEFERLWHAVQDAILYVHEPPTFQVFASILRAATDLEFLSFRKWAVRTFEDMWPLSIESVTHTNREYAAESIELARACDVPKVLRHAFYELSRHPSFGLADELIEGNDEGESGSDEAHALTEPDPTLSRDDLLRLIQLRSRLQTDWLSVVQMVPASCKKEGCFISGRTWFKTLMQGHVFEEGLMFDVLGGLQQLCKMDLQGQKKATKDGGFRLCAACEMQARTGWERRRTKIWKDHLDLWIGLE